jgi:hypothetical protein|tara:strand:- start:710 stop:940 length:231 start_codon:yes stop_codon:yes gene_type:complete
MSLDYKKRLLELRRFAEQEFSPNSENISTQSKKSLVKKPKNQEEKPEYSPKEIQEAAFLEVIVSNLNIKDGVNDSV